MISFTHFACAWRNDPAEWLQQSSLKQLYHRAAAVILPNCQYGGDFLVPVRLDKADTYGALFVEIKKNLGTCGDCLPSTLFGFPDHASGNRRDHDYLTFNDLDIEAVLARSCPVSDHAAVAAELRALLPTTERWSLGLSRTQEAMIAGKLDGWIKPVD